jgi:hypothetical protein
MLISAILMITLARRGRVKVAHGHATADAAAPLQVRAADAADAATPAEEARR